MWIGGTKYASDAGLSITEFSKEGIKDKSKDVFITETHLWDMLAESVVQGDMGFYVWSAIRCNMKFRVPPRKLRGVAGPAATSSMLKL